MKGAGRAGVNRWNLVLVRKPVGDAISNQGKPTQGPSGQLTVGRTQEHPALLDALIEQISEMPSVSLDGHGSSLIRHPHQSRRASHEHEGRRFAPVDQLINSHGQYLNI